METSLSSISFQIIRPSIASVANNEEPRPKVNYCPIKAAVRALSPVIIFTSWEDSLSS